MAGEITETAGYADKLGTRKSDAGAIFFVRLCSWLNVLFVGCILLMGVQSMLKGIIAFFFEADEKSHVSIAVLMDGLEFYLLAPLGYILLRTLGNYLYAIRKNAGGYADPESSAALMSVKGLTTGLLIAVLATHLVAVFLEQNASSATVFPWAHVLCGVLLLLALIAYFSVIERCSHLANHGPPKKSLKKQLEQTLKDLDDEEAEA